MGRRGKSKLEVPLPARESDVSDMDSVAISSVAADQDLGSDDETPMALHLIDILAENVENISDKRNNTRVKAMANLVAIFQKSIVDEDLEKWKGSICDALDKNLRRTDDESVLACSVIGLLAIQKAMANLVAIFQKSIVDEDLEKWKGSICDALDKNLRRTDDESILACSVIGLLAIQKAFDIEEEMHPLLQTLVTLCNDYSKPEAVRSKAVHALGIASFFSSDQPAAIQTYLSSLYNIWSSTKSSATSSVLFCSALESWTLLLHR
uniref:Interferon-related developmental regulator N-terminal domain-containing protein n=1 Tax=Panagrolaimus sp. PS1159 TaxID=55785 RepID=A0AC35GEN8_9BILA